MKVGDLVRMAADHEDDDIGIVVKVTLTKARKRALVFWGPESTFGSQVEWDWEKDLEVISESR